MTHWQLCKKLKFNHTIKQYMHKPESVLENETHKILWDFKIQKKSPNLVQKTKELAALLILQCENQRKQKVTNNWTLQEN